MVAYFKRENNLFMLLGGILGLAVAVLFYDQLTAGIPGYFKLFFVFLPIIIGTVLFRIMAGFWSNRKLQKLNALLYNQVDPEGFLRVFAPIVARAPKDNIAYVDGCNKLAYAYEALGRFDEAMAQIEPLEPEKLKLHMLGGLAATCNTRARLLLLQNNVTEAQSAVENLRLVAETAEKRAPVLGKNVLECVRLYENWLSVLNKQPADEVYLMEEIQLSKNRIHKSEMQLLLAQAYENRGELPLADELRLEVLTTGKDLWTETEARKLLGTQ